MPNMCDHCRKQEHEKCKGKAHCFCQHRKTVRLPDGRIAQADSDNEFQGRLAGA